MKKLNFKIGNGTFLCLYPHILKECLEINKDINKSLQTNTVEERSYNFDLILPFLIRGISAEEARIFSRELQLHREIINQYNKGNKSTEKLVLQLQKGNSHFVRSFEEYCEINHNHRTLEDKDILNSYIQSTERVYYRFDFVKQLSITDELKKQLLNQIKVFSAFLLFDDDVCDLENDLNNNKNTILIQYLKNGNNLEDAIDLFVNSLTEIQEPILKDFSNQFIKIYQ